MKTIKFKDFVALQRGFDLPKAKRVKGNVPLVASSKIDGSHNTFKVKAPGVVTGRSGSLGRVQYISKAFWPLNTTLWVKDFKGNNEKYIYYFLQTLDLAQYNSGAGVPTLNRNHLDELLINVHEYCEQTKIEKLLSNYDHLIENNNRRIAILEDMAQSLYREWFVNFRYPGHADDVDKDGNQKLIDSPLGQIPDGWVVKTLKDVVELAYGKALKKPDRKGGSVVVYGSGGFGGYHDKTLVEGPCIIVGRKGNVGKVFWVDQDCWPIDTVFYVKSEFSKFYLYYNLLHQTFFNSDAAVPGLNRESAYCNKIILPSAELVTQFNEFIKPIFKQRYLISKANNNLKLQRDMLLPKLISGQIEL
jgi:type I restriction enzyme S subunit